MDELFKGARDFHGHLCPGLTIGYRAAQVSLREIGKHSRDEEVVAIVETDMCAVDAIQYMTGCTFGKGNLIHLDYGKNAFTFVRRSDNRAIRIITRPFDWPGLYQEEFQALSQKISNGIATEEDQKRFWEIQQKRSVALMEMPEDQLFEIKEVEPEVPRKARLRTSVKCDACGEMAMETRIRRFNGKNLCTPCFQQAESR